MAYRDFSDFTETNGGAASAAITLAADEKVQYLIRKIFASATGVPTVHTLTIAYNPASQPGTTKTITLRLPLAAGEHPFAFDIVCARNTQVVITYTATSATAADLAVLYNKQAVTL